jgi:hypothetical protein
MGEDGRRGKTRKTREAALDALIERVRKEIASVAAGSDPVLAGPFTGEIGFELLYWIPMVRWAAREFPELQGRLVYVSRGGVKDWLVGLDAYYVDLLSLLPPEDFATHRALSDKQRQVREFEERAVEAVKHRLGFKRANVLHPSVLYNAYFRFLKVNELVYPKSLLHQEDGTATGLTSIYRAIDVPPLPPELEFLPDEYVAVHFYSSESFPESDESRRFAARVIDALAKRTNVVLLGHRFEIDDHRKLDSAELDSTDHHSVITIDHLMRPENNLTIQTPVVGRARAFVGTYGGFSYLSPFLGVPSLSFSMDRSRTHSWHQVLAQRLFEDERWGDFVSLRHDDLSLIELVADPVAPKERLNGADQRRVQWQR